MKTHQAPPPVRTWVACCVALGLLAVTACGTPIIGLGEDQPDVSSADSADATVDADETTTTDVASTDVDVLTTCNNGVCDGDETVANCPADCSFLLNRYGGPCTKPGTADVCASGYICVPRSVAAGGNICVADFDSWPPIADAHPVGDFNEFTDYVVDTKTGLSWAKESLPSMTAAQALSACVSQTYGGLDDWREPTLAELASLLDRSKLKPACSAPQLQWSFADNFYWSATPVSDVPVSDVTVTYEQNFTDGYNHLAGVELPAGVPFKRPVRCVRAAVGGTEGTGCRFLKQADGLTILDRTTGLHWQWYYSKDKMDFVTAGNWCSHNTAGMPGSGWRLPTAGELFQLANRQRGRPAIDATFAVLNVPNEGYWSSTQHVTTGLAWTVTFEYGFYVNAATLSQQLVRCVR